MLGKWIRLFVLITGFALIGTATFINRKIDAMYFGEPPVTYLLPKPEMFRYLSLGYDKAVASLMFSNLVGSISWNKEPPAYSRWVYNTVTIITTLDQRLFGAYQAGAYFLRDQDEQGQDWAIEIMSKATDITDRFEAPLLVAMVYFSDKHDRPSAARWFTIASKRKDAPDYVARIAAGIMTDSDPEAAMDVLLGAYCSTPLMDRKERLVYEYLAYFEKYEGSPEQTAGFIQAFFTRLQDPRCSSTEEKGLDWVSPKLRDEINRVIASKAKKI